MLATPLPQDMDAERWLDALKVDLGMLRHPSAAEDPAVQLGARDIMAKLGYRLNSGGQAFWTAAELFAKASAEQLTRTAERATGVLQPHDALFADTSPASAPCQASFYHFRRAGGALYREPQPQGIPENTGRKQSYA